MNQLQVAIRMARPTEDDQQVVIDFWNFLEEYLEYHTHTPTENDEPRELTQDEFVLLLFEKWQQVSRSWSRVYWAGRTAIENACDPDLDYLGFKPELQAAARERDELRELLAKIKAAATELHEVTREIRAVDEAFGGSV